MNQNNSQLYQTAGLLINCQTGEVSNQQQHFRLSPVNARVLAVLLKNAGTAVSRQQLFDAVWPNQVVSDDALTRCISDLRAQLKALTTVEPLIETIPKVGYRWLPSINNEEHNAIDSKSSKFLWSEQLKPILLALLILVVLLWGFLGVLYFWGKPSLMPVVILPTEYRQELSNQDTQNTDVTLWLKQAVMQQTDMQYLASSAMNSHSGNPFPYYNHEFGVRWFIESQIKLTAEQNTLTLNLIDAKTALVIFSQQHPFKQAEELKAHCQAFVDFVAQL